MIGARRRRLRPWLLLLGIGLVVAGYFLAAHGWAKVYKLQGPAWFGEKVEARILNRASFVETTWNGGAQNPDYKTNIHTRVRYGFDVGGKTYGYPFEQGYARVPEADAKGATIAVYYLPEDPANNYPTSTSYKYADPMAGVVMGGLMLLGGLVSLLLVAFALLFGTRDPQMAGQVATAAPSVVP